MFINNKIENSFGPLWSKVGIVFMLATMVTMNHLPLAIGLFLFGALLLFTTNRVLIDTAKKRVKITTQWFGLFSFGKWLCIEPNMKLRIRKIANDWQLNSLSNRNISLRGNAFHVLLLDANDFELITLAKSKSEEMASLELEKINTHLKLEIR